MWRVVHVAHPSRSYMVVAPAEEKVPSSGPLYIMSPEMAKFISWSHAGHGQSMSHYAWPYSHGQSMFTAFLKTNTTSSIIIPAARSLNAFCCIIRYELPHSLTADIYPHCSCHHGCHVYSDLLLYGMCCCTADRIMAPSSSSAVVSFINMALAVMVMMAPRLLMMVVLSAASHAVLLY